MTVLNMEQRGQAYEYLAMTRGAAFINWVVERAIRIAHQIPAHHLAAHRAMQQKQKWGGTLDALRELPYTIIGEVSASNPATAHESTIVQAYSDRIAAIEAGEFAERIEDAPPPTYEQRRQDLIEELLTDASAAVERTGLQGCEISVESVSPDECDDFVRQNGAAQLVIMDNGDSVDNAGEAFGVVIRNVQGHVVHGVMARVATVSLKSTKTDETE